MDTREQSQVVKFSDTIVGDGISLRCDGEWSLSYDGSSAPRFPRALFYTGGPPIAISDECAFKMLAVMGMPKYLIE